MGQSLTTGRAIRVAVGPAFNYTSIKFLDVYVRQAWLEAERKLSQYT